MGGGRGDDRHPVIHILHPWFAIHMLYVIKSILLVLHPCPPYSLAPLPSTLENAPASAHRRTRSFKFPTGRRPRCAVTGQQGRSFRLDTRNEIPRFKKIDKIRYICELESALLAILRSSPNEPRLPLQILRPFAYLFAHHMMAAFSKRCSSALPCSRLCAPSERSLKSHSCLP